MKPLLVILLCLLATYAFARQPSGDLTVTWRLASPEQIERLGKRMGHGKGVIALAYPYQKPCAIMMARPPEHDAAEAVVREYIHTLNHELRHCREGVWHRPNIAEPR